ncbi:hypothetical protein [Rhizobium mongolense]|uniref:hypothetical protein n=1 Tax=Rhizobium mongolense TaxID=57676 RepID=UPI0034A56ECA
MQRARTQVRKPFHKSHGFWKSHIRGAACSEIRAGDVDKIKAGDEAEGVIAGLPFQAALCKAEANRTNASANHGTL